MIYWRNKRKIIVRAQICRSHAQIRCGGGGNVPFSQIHVYRFYCAIMIHFRQLMQLQRQQQWTQYHKSIKTKQMILTATFRFLLLDVILQSTFSHLCKSTHKRRRTGKSRGGYENETNIKWNYIQVCHTACIHQAIPVRLWCKEIIINNSRISTQSIRTNTLITQAWIIKHEWRQLQFNPPFVRYFVSIIHFSDKKNSISMHVSKTPYVKLYVILSWLDLFLVTFKKNT